ncbi:hypothetical protein [Tepidanaerobacter syntrophicus]|uniref:hypothetical protein n=1 Tax=Tepidanaerobacter syntrophicus TaxID=224999 RepID=UPI001BD68397|nr:hypothetical protein [Tepidanaerobacter syntrophicus]
MEQNRKINEVLQLLSQAWAAYARNFPNGKNYDKVLRAIQEAQLAVFEEDTPG